MKICQCDNCESFFETRNLTPYNPETFNLSFLKIESLIEDNGKLICHYCETDRYLTEIEDWDKINPHLYYRLFDTQIKKYLSSGYNSVGFKNLAADFVNYYFSENNDEKPKKLDPKRVVQMASDADFSLQISEFPFPLEDIDASYLNEIPVSLVKKISGMNDATVKVLLKNNTFWFTESLYINGSILIGQFYQ